MKKKSKRKFDFSKTNILELNNLELTNVKGGGSSMACVTASSAGCALLANIVLMSDKFHFSVFDAQ